MEEKKHGTNTVTSQYEDGVRNGQVSNGKKVESIKLKRSNSEVQAISDENYDNVSKTFNVVLRRTKTSDLSFLVKADEELSSDKSESCCVIM